MKDKKTTDNKLLRRQVYDLLGVEIPPKPLFRAVTMLITLRHPEDIARIIQQGHGKSSLKPPKVAELLRNWYPSREERDSRFPANARKIFFPEEFPVDVRVEPVPVKKSSAIKTAKSASNHNAGFVPMGEFNPERPFRASLVGKQIMPATPVTVPDPVEKPARAMISD